MYTVPFFAPLSSDGNRLSPHSLSVIWEDEGGLRPLNGKKASLYRVTERKRERKPKEEKGENKTFTQVHKFLIYWISLQESLRFFVVSSMQEDPSQFEGNSLNTVKSLQ